VSILLVHSERFVEHEPPPGHPERPERAEVFDVVANRWRGRGADVIAPRSATREHLLRIHDADYVQKIADAAGKPARLDPDTFMSPESYEIALLAAGGTIDAVERVMNGPTRAAVALVRPPGHHAERARAMGFCLFNNIAIGAAHARAHGAGRVAIVDYDVHHGNATQHTFEPDPQVLYVSTHQYPFYPGTGAAGEIGRDAGRGFTVNLPLEAGAVAEDFHLVFSDVILPILRQFKPDLMMISAGFDAHEADPLGGLRLTADAFAAMTMELRQVAEECCRGRVVAVTEGGYDLHALAESLDAVVSTLDGPAGPARWPSSGIASTRGRASADQARKALGPFWKL